MNKLEEPTLCSIPTRLGTFTAGFSSRGLCQLDFPRRNRNGARRHTGKSALNDKLRLWLAETEVALNESLSGRRVSRFPKLDLSQGTPFQREVWKVLQRISAGQSRSYGEIASKIGRPKAFRAVGQACGANPVPILIPCHRALAANGKLGGFSGGLDWKKRLLSIEKIDYRN